MANEQTPSPAPSELGHEPTAETVNADAPSSDAVPPPPADAAPEGTAEPSDESDEEGDTEAETAEGDEAEAAAGTAEGAAEGAKKKKRRRKKKKPAAEGAEGQQRQVHRAPERAPFRVGEEVFGKVTAVLDEALMIDLAGKALAVFDRGEMADDDLVPGVADRFVAQVHNDGARGGLVVLTRKPLREEETKPRVEAAQKDGTLVKGLVTGVIKGGIDVVIDGLRAFAPASGMDLHPANANFAHLVGQRLEFKVLQYEKAGRDVVVTRRPMLEAEAHERRKQALTLLTEGQVMPGIVRTVVEWGVFVALPEAENLEGLVHVSEASHDARAKLTDIFKPGEKIDVKITKIDEKGKIWLSRKAQVEDPWAAAREKYALNTKHMGRIKSVLDFGAFVELEPGVEGLLHVADLSFERIEDPKTVLTEGAEMEVVIVHVDGRNRKLALCPAPQGEQANEAPQKIARNASVKVEVVKIEGTAGLVVRVLGVLGRQSRGFLPAGQTGTPRGTELRKVFKLNSIIDAKVVDIDPRRGEPKLSIRGLAEDEERRATKEYRQQLKAQGGFGTLGDLFRSKLGK